VLLTCRKLVTVVLKAELMHAQIAGQRTELSLISGDASSKQVCGFTVLVVRFFCEESLLIYCENAVAFHVLSGAWASITYMYILQCGWWKLEMVD
jgi:hypothetical protein